MGARRPFQRRPVSSGRLHLWTTPSIGAATWIYCIDGGRFRRPARFAGDRALPPREQTICPKPEQALQTLPLPHGERSPEAPVSPGHAPTAASLCALTLTESHPLHRRRQRSARAAAAQLGDLPT